MEFVEANAVRIPITEETKEWSPNLDTQLPINQDDIPKFAGWIDWNGFQLDRQTGQGHDGFDFAAYLTTDNEIVFGLPPGTKIRAVADGKVTQILENELTGGGYGALINIEHGADDSGMFSSYHHIKPLMTAGIKVKKGDVIAELYKDVEGEEGRLVHLHMMLTSGWGVRGTGWSGGRNRRLDDPRLIDGSIYHFKAEPQGSAGFVVPLLPDVRIQVANFTRVRVNE